MIISLSGKPGSGKSSVATRLAADLNFPRHYVGGLRRAAAKAKGMTLAEFNKLGEQSDITDREFDEFVTRMGKTEDNFIIESRTAFRFIPHSVKIFLDVTPEAGAQRIWDGMRAKEGSQLDRNEAKNLDSYEDVVTAVKERLASDNTRYQKYYQVDIFDPKHYDLFLDTTGLPFEEVYQQVKEFVAQAKRTQ